MDLGGLGLDLALRPQPAFCLSGFFPQLLNGLEVTGAHRRLPDAAVAINKVLTPRGRVSRRARPDPFRPHTFRAQWGLSDLTRLICMGNYKDPWLEKLWATTRAEGDLWRTVRILGFDFATSLNFSIYLDDPRLEQLVNVKRTWLTVEAMQRTSSLIPIPHLQWATPHDLDRQLAFVQAQGFHTVTVNLQMARTRTWQTLIAGVPAIRDRAPELRFLFSGTAGLRRLARLAELFPGAAFTSATPHFLAQHYVRLQRDGLRLIKEPVEGHPDLILAENVRLMQTFVASTNGQGRTESTSQLEDDFQAFFREVTETLRARAGMPADEAAAAFDRLAADPAILAAATAWLRTGRLERNFRGDFGTWPAAGGEPRPTLGQLLDRGLAPLDAFLRLADLACQVDEAMQALAGRAGH